MDRPVLVLGATGYVGSRLVPRLVGAGRRVRASSRTIEKLESRVFGGDPRVELVAADALNEDSLRRAMEGCEVVYYLVHSMEAGHKRDFAKRDLQAAQNAARAAEAAGVSRIVYLGGLGETGEDLSEHLRSRQEVATALRGGSVPVTTLRAAVILGSGSASFEILRYLVDRLPVMITPRWLSTPVQPIAIRNVLGYLVGCLDAPETTGGTFDIGGPEVVTYRKLMEIYAEEAGLRKRIVFPVPVLTPRLSSYWIHLVTPAPASLAQPLAEGLRNPVVCADERIRALVPQTLISCRDAIRLAIDATQEERVESSWLDVSRAPPAAWRYAGDAAWTGGDVLRDEREMRVEASPDRVWDVISSLGGRDGWRYANTLWRLRGAVDKMVGGVGLRRGRLHPTQLRVGDAVDFWRVATVEEGKLLRLTAEMRLPGHAVLEFRIAPTEDGATMLTQRALFRARGIGGSAYWYGIYPLHALVFRGMLHGIAREAERGARRGRAARGARA